MNDHVMMRNYLPERFANNYKTFFQENSKGTVIQTVSLPKDRTRLDDYIPHWMEGITFLTVDVMRMEISIDQFTTHKMIGSCYNLCAVKENLVTRIFLRFGLRWLTLRITIWTTLKFTQANFYDWRVLPRERIVLSSGKGNIGDIVEVSRERILFLWLGSTSPIGSMNIWKKATDF